MELLIKNGLVLKGSNFYHKDVLIKDGVISKVEKEIPVQGEMEVFDAKEQLITPGFIDIHTHGAVGVDSNHVNVENLEKLSEFYATQGVTTWLLSLVTDSKEVMVKSATAISDYLKETERTDNLLGIHMEGPFLSMDYKGAQPEQYVIGFSRDLFDAVIEASENRVKYITVAPEVKGVLDNIDYMQEKGVVVSVGHSSADYATTKKAIEKGASTVTHTFNAMRLFHQHEPGMMGAVLEADNMYYEAICDGKHLVPATINMLLSLKGPERVICITDSIMATGLPDGEYILGANEVIVADGDAKLKSNGVRAGSTLTLQKALLNLLEFTDLSIGQILPMLTINPAKAIHIDDEYGSIEVGKKANILRLDHDGNILDTWIQGHKAYEKA